MAETCVTRIRIEGRRATGIDYIGPDGVERSMDAKLIIVAGGAIETPRLLLMSGLDHPALGRHLMVHFQTIVVGHFEHLSLHPHIGRSVTHVHDDAMVQDDASRAAAAEDGLPWIRGGLVEHSGGGHLTMEALHTPWGPLHAQAMKASNLGQHMWAFIMQGEDLAYSTNTVDLSPSIRDARGLPVARITYKPGHHELAASKHHGKILQGVLEEMGSDWTIHTSSSGCLVPRYRSDSYSRKSSRDWHCPNGRRPGDVRRRPMGKSALVGQRGGRRLVSFRYVIWVWADPHLGRAGGSGGSSFGQYQAFTHLTQVHVRPFRLPRVRTIYGSSELLKPPPNIGRQGVGDEAYVS